MTRNDFDPKMATQTTFKDAIRIGLDDAFAALAESFAGLTDEQFWAFPLPRRSNVVTLVEHCLQCLDLYGCEVQGKPLTFEPEKRFDIWHFTPDQLRPQMTDLPSTETERARVAAVRKAVMAQLADTRLADLAKPNMSSWWFEEQPEKVRADAYMRAVYHTDTHVRQIWLLRGAMGLTDDQGWPRQHWA